MHDFISPYDLLCQSKPKKAPTFVTPYDLYSRAGQSDVHARDHIIVPESAAVPDRQPAPPSFDAPAAVRRTHYITDIQTRHSAAEKNAVLSNTSLK